MLLRACIQTVGKNSHCRLLRIGRVEIPAKRSRITNQSLKITRFLGTLTYLTITEGIFQELTKPKKAGYFEQKMIEFPSIYPGFQLSKKMGRKIGKKAFFEIERVYGNQKDFLNNSKFKYLGAANEKCDVFSVEINDSSCFEKRCFEQVLREQDSKVGQWFNQGSLMVR